MTLEEINAPGFNQESFSEIDLRGYFTIDSELRISYPNALALAAAASTSDTYLSFSHPTTIIFNNNVAFRFIISIIPFKKKT